MNIRKKRLLSFTAVLMLMLLCGACNPAPVSAISPSNTPAETVASTLTPTIAPTLTTHPTITVAPAITASPVITTTLTSTVTPTAVPTATPTVAPTATPTLTATPTPKYTFKDIHQTMYVTGDVNVRTLPSTEGTKIGNLSSGTAVNILRQCNETNWYEFEYQGKTAYASNKYFSASKPTPTATPKPTATPIPAGGGFPELTYKENVIMNDTLFTSEADATRYFFEMVKNNYYQFGILVEDLSMLHTPAEYMEMFPEVFLLEAESLTKYNNGYVLQFSYVETVPIDIEHRYAIRTGDTSYMNDRELAAYQKLLAVSEELNLDELSDIDIIIAVHDYLILNTAYDDATVISGEDTAAHYIEGTLLDGLAVCSGYASTFQMFMLLHDIPCEYVWNTEHAWNIVELDGQKYHIDVTWDDPSPDVPGQVLYDHFMMTDAEIARLDSHSIEGCECTGNHNCTDSSYRLYPYRDYLCTTEEEAAALIKAQITEDMITLIYPAAGFLTEDSLLQLFFDTLNFQGEISYYPAELLTDTHYILRILTP